MGMSFTNLPKSKQFNITTRFYDPQKEAMKEREERIRREMGMNMEGEPVSYHGAAIKGSFRNAGRINSKSLAEVRKKSNKRILYILIALLALLYFFLK
jgi:hypothetical protein